jgi:peptidyl-prolyl cis-trans isomerase B (cyclophilin B)
MLRRRSRLSAAASALALTGLLALGGCGDEGGDSATDGGSSGSELDLASIPTGAPVACDYADDSRLPKARDVQKPPAEAAYTGEIPVVLATTLGNLDLTLDATGAPCTVASFLSLADQGYYDDTPCHRLVTPQSGGLSVLQCGDPSGQGTGGPGYTVPDELDGSETYPAGTLAMANTGQPDTNGSQFFMVYADTQLPPQYTVFGTIDQAGVDAIAALAEKGVAADGVAPAEAVDIESVSLG